MSGMRSGKRQRAPSPPPQSSAGVYYTNSTKKRFGERFGRRPDSGPEKSKGHGGFARCVGIGPRRRGEPDSDTKSAVSKQYAPYDGKRVWLCLRGRRLWDGDFYADIPPTGIH